MAHVGDYYFNGKLTNAVTLSSGQTIYRVHAPTMCANEHCTIHNPSDHHMRDWPQWWNESARYMQRECPHGHKHKDPDDPAIVVEVDCDGCCTYDPVAEAEAFEAYRTRLLDTYEEIT